MTGNLFENVGMNWTHVNLLLCATKIVKIQLNAERKTPNAKCRKQPSNLVLGVKRSALSVEHYSSAVDLLKILSRKLVGDKLFGNFSIGRYNGQVQLIIVEPYFDLKTPNSIASQTGAKVLVLPPSVGGVPQASDYLKLFDTQISMLTDAIKSVGAK